MVSLPPTRFLFIATDLAEVRFPRGLRSTVRALRQRPYVVRVLGPIRGYGTIHGHKPVKPSAIDFPFQVQRICNGHWILRMKDASVTSA